ncbi:hypothetical protein DL897_06425 [Thermoflavimicrobium daqui]|jgi:hypothetical protein|uniref:Uncharacterized protein n=1 Tax=Thermoflavimicrobium daqui TaxID=2137476 RepID=A0A364K5Z4_9BACL|nr:hypothetical protein DL897_06425 [Thermoflavimicrobium daqui]
MFWIVTDPIRSATITPSCKKSGSLGVDIVDPKDKELSNKDCLPQNNKVASTKVILLKVKKGMRWKKPRS